MKILILGGAGMLGHQVYLAAREKFGPEHVSCTLRKAVGHYERFSLFTEANVFDKVDLLDFTSTQKVLEKFQPTHIINCVGLTLRKPEMGDAEKSLEINGMLPHRLAKWGATNNAKVIHYSTDCVFDGKKGNYTENDIPSAKDLYGQSKFLGEVGYTNALTMRLSIVGRELEGKTELIEWFLQQKGKTIKGFTNAMYSGLTTNAVAAETLRVINGYPNLSGTYHVASEPISKFDLLTLTNEIYQAGVEIQRDAAHASDKTLNCDLYSKLTGFIKPSWRQMLTEMRHSEKVNYGK